MAPKTVPCSHGHSVNACCVQGVPYPCPIGLLLLVLSPTASPLTSEASRNKKLQYCMWACKNVLSHDGGHESTWG